MLNVLKKELRLATPKGVWLFCLLGVLMIVPQYPMIVGVGYSLLAIFIAFQYAKENRDTEFSSTLPISRDRIVKGKIALVVTLEFAQILFSIPFAVIADALVSPQGNLVGMDPNLAFFGIVLLCLSAYNLIMLPLYFRTGYKLGIPLLLALAAFLVVYAVCEFVIQFVPALRGVLDTLDPAAFGYQAILLAAGILVYVGTLSAAVKLSVKNFEKVSI